MASPKRFPRRYLYSSISRERLPTQTAEFKDIECGLRTSKSLKATPPAPLCYSSPYSSIEFLIFAALQILVSRMPVNTRVPQRGV